MDFRRIEVPAYSGWEGGYKLGDTFIIPNGDINCEVTFYVTSPALKHWSKNILNQFGLSTNDALTEFSKQNLKKFQGSLLLVLDKLIQHYRGFPSPIHLTEKLWFCFDEGTYLAASKKWYRDFKVVFICFNVNYLKIPQSHIVNLIRHELFHTISEIHEGQENTIKNIRIWQDRLKNTIDKNKKTVYNGVNELLDYCDKNSLEHQIIFKQIEASIEHFYQYSVKMFWNLICDSALSVIAIELDDMSYIRFNIKRDEDGVRSLRGKLGRANKVLPHIIKNEFDEKKRNFLSETLKLLQFITCFEGMPYESVAYGILGDDWRPKMKRHFARNMWKSWHKNKSSKNIEDFKKTVITYCKSDVAEGFLRFYDSYLHIIKAQAIHNNPLNPDITQQIHNTECLNRGKEAYKMLNREFYKLFKELKKYE